MTAGTSRSKWDGEGPNTEQCGSFLAALIASLVAQCTEAARSNGGSPDAATKGTQVSRTENLRVKISEVYLAIYAHTQPPINICKACA